MNERYDIAICGGGLVGASLALALARLDYRVALIEAAPFGRGEQPSFDDRTTAISNGTQRIFNALGVWCDMERAATPIRRIHVSQRGRFGAARINAQEQDLPQLGFVVVNRDMGQALWRALQTAKIDIHAPARVVATSVAADARTVKLDRGEALAARLVVAADGAQSVVREAAGIGVSVRDYEQAAVIANIACQRFHQYTAYERFTDEGAIALLPLNDARMGVVWVASTPVAQALTSLSEAEFLARLQAAFGLRLGRFTQLGKRAAYPLSLTEAERHTAERLAVVGNAAQGLHPIAGQGFNLGLRDAACLAEVLADAPAQSSDPGDAAVLRRYADWRARDRGGIVRFTDGLVELFRRDFGPLNAMRSVGLALFDLSPHAKHYLAQLSLGAAGKIPRMARGGALRP